MTKVTDPRYLIEDDEIVLKRWLPSSIALGFCLGVIFAMFRVEVISAVTVWTESHTYNHSFLVLPVALWLVWRERHKLAAASPRPSALGLAVLALGAAMWLAGYVASIMEVRHFAFVTILQGVVITIIGHRVWMRLWFPMLYLYFLVPSGEFMVPALQDFTAVFVVRGLQMVGVPVYSDGIMIHIPNGSFEVAEACAGLRFLIANVAFGFLFAYVVLRDWKKRLAFAALSVVVPIIANGFRAFMIVMLAHWTDNRLAAGADHLVYGWVFFAFVMALLILIGAKMERPQKDPPKPDAPSATSAAPAPSWLFGLAAIAALGMAAAGPAFAAWNASHLPPVNAEALEAPRLVGAWQRAEPADDWRPSFNGADAELRASYRDSDGARVHLYVGFYAAQRGESKIISTLNGFEDGEIWRRVGGDADATLRREILAQHTIPPKRRVVWHYYWVNGEKTGLTRQAKLLQARAELLGGLRSAAVIAIAADAATDAEAERLLTGFTEALPDLDAMLRRAAVQE